MDSSPELRSPELELDYRAPLDWPALADFLGRRAIAGLEEVSGGGYQRTFDLDGEVGVVAVRPLPAKHTLGVWIAGPKGDGSQRVRDKVRGLFDLDADPPAVAAHLGSDPLLAGGVWAHPGLRVPGAWDGFELAVRAVIGQQVTVKGAATLAARLVALCGQPLGQAGSQGLSHAFPAPGVLAEADLGEVGLTRTRASTVRGLASAVAQGRVRFDGAGGPAALIDSLTALHGIGDWTAQYVAMRALHAPDAFPASDLVLRRVAADGAADLTAARLRAMAEPWRPWRAYAAMHLWRLAVDRET